MGREEQAERKKPWQVGGWAWYTCLFTVPVLVLTAVEGMTRGGLGGVAGWVLAQPVAAILTLVAFLAFEVVFTALTGRLWVGALIPSVAAVGFGIANYCKVAVNGTVLLLSDLVMAAHLPTLIGYLPTQLMAPIGVALALAVVIVVCAQVGGPLPNWWKPWQRRGLAALAASCLLLCVLLGPWGWYVGDVMDSQEDRNDRLGLTAGLYASVLSRATQMAQIGSVEAVETLAETEPEAEPEPEETPEPESAVQPNVVLLMSESFCDPTALFPEVHMNADPIPNFHALSAEWPSGPFYSNTYAGGTGNVEMEVFTGIPIGLLPEGEDLTTISGEGAYDRIPSIVRAFRDGGYSTRFIHNYTTRLYNRVENFPKLGFETLTFEEDFPEDAPWAGPYLADMALAEEMIRAFEEKEEGKPLFLYGLSMENHQPISKDKFGEPSGLEPTCEDMNEDQLGIMDALAYALRGADESLGALVDYLEDYPEPVILVFWGDHLPGLSAGEGKVTLYSLQGHVPIAETTQWDAETMKQMHSTNFVVWNNFDAQLEVPAEVSATSLGTHILDWAGMEKPPFFRWVDEAQKTMFLYRKRLYIDDEKVPYRQIPERDQDLMEQYQQLVYAILYGGKEPEDVLGG